VLLASEGNIETVVERSRNDRINEYLKDGMYEELNKEIFYNTE